MQTIMGAIKGNTWSLAYGLKGCLDLMGKEVGTGSGILGCSALHLESFKL